MKEKDEFRDEILTNLFRETQSQKAPDHLKLKIMEDVRKVYIARKQKQKYIRISFIALLFTIILSIPLFNYLSIGLPGNHMPSYTELLEFISGIKYLFIFVAGIIFLLLAERLFRLNAFNPG